MKPFTRFLGYLASFLAGATVLGIPGYLVLVHFILLQPLSEMSLIKAEIQLLKSTDLQLEPQFVSMRKVHCMVLRGSLENLQEINQWQLPVHRFERDNQMKQEAEETLRLLKDTTYCEPAEYQRYLENMTRLNLTPL